MSFDASTAQPEAVQSVFDPGTATLVPEQSSFDPSTAKPVNDTPQFDPDTAKLVSAGPATELRAATPEDMQQQNWLERGWNSVVGQAKEYGTDISERLSEAKKGMDQTPFAQAAMGMGLVHGAAALIRPSPGEQSRDQQSQEAALGPDFMQSVAARDQRSREIGDASGYEQLFGSDKSPLQLPLWAPGQVVGKRNAFAEPITKDDENTNIQLSPNESIKLSTLKAVYQPFARVWNMMASPGGLITQGAGIEVAAAKAGTQAAGAAAAITPVETAVTAGFTKDMTAGAIQQLSDLPKILSDPNKTDAQKFSAATDTAFSIGFPAFGARHLSEEVRNIAIDPTLTNDAKIDAIAKSENLSHDDVVKQVADAGAERMQQMEMAFKGKPLPDDAIVTPIVHPETGEVLDHQITIPGKEGDAPRFDGSNSPIPTTLTYADAVNHGYDVSDLAKPGEITGDTTDRSVSDGIEHELSKAETKDAPVDETSTADQPEGQLHGVAARVLDRYTEEGSLPKIDPMPGNSAEDIVSHGEEMLKAGYDPQEVADRLTKGGAATPEDAALLRAQDRKLYEGAKGAEQQFGKDSPEYAAAAKAHLDWVRGPMATLRAAWSETGRSFQGERNLDTGDFHSVASDIQETTGQEQLTKAQSDKVKEVTDASAKAEKEAQAKKDAFLKKAAENEPVAKAPPGIAKYLKTAADAARARMRERMTEAAANPFLDPKRVAESLQDLSVVAAEHLVKGIDAGAALVKEFGDAIKPHLKDILDEARKQLNDAYETTATAAMERRKAALEKQIEEKKAALASGDIEPKSGKVGRPLPEELEKATQERDALNKQIADARSAARKEARDEAAKADMSPTGIRAKFKAQWESGERDPGKIFNKISLDTGLSENEIYDRLTQSKDLKGVTDDMFRAMADARDRRKSVESFIKSQKAPGWETLAQQFPRAHFKLATAGHGLVFGVTHAGNMMLNPTAWRYYWPNFFRQSAMLFNRGYHERMMGQLEREPLFEKAKHLGLDIDPKETRDDITAAWASKGMQKFGLTGNRGADALKLMRMEAFKEEWSKIPDSMKNDQYGKTLAEQINAATGSARVNAPAFVKAAAFALKLKAAQWKWAIKDPCQAVATLVREELDKGYTAAGKEAPYWMKVSEGEYYLAIRELRQKAFIIATMAALLDMNQGLLSATGSNQKINFTDTKADDFLRFKGFGKQATPVAPILAIYKLFGNMLHINFGKRTPYEQRDSRYVESTKYGAQYLRGQLSPAAGFATDMVTQSDMFGRPMPFSDEKVPASVRRQGDGKYTWGEYLATHFTNLPIEEALREGFKQHGADETTATHWIHAIENAGIGMATGMRPTQDRHTIQDPASLATEGAGSTP